MTESSDKSRKKKKNTNPEQKLGDTPVSPWDMPTPDEKKEAKPVRRALKEAVKQVDSQEKADRVIEDLEAATADQTTTGVKQTQPPADSPAAAAQQVQDAARSADGRKKTKEVLKETARVIAASEGKPQEVVAEAAQEVFNPEQQGGVPTLATEQELQFLQKAVLKRLKPLDALDANLFLAINHLPHTRVLNGFFYSLTLAFQSVTPWYTEMGIAALRQRRKAKKLFWEAAVPLLITSSLVELIIKPYFKRRRPFIKIIRAIVIGKKPGTWSFPSGHAAGAFAGAWLLNNKFPKFSLLRYFVASMVGFSRIYLGDHYPGDVVSGSLIGLLFAMLFRRMAGRG